MSDEPAPIVVNPRSKSRVKDYLILAIILCGVFAAAFYQEQISSFFRLRQWDSGAPGRVVVEFLEAGQKGDKQTADRLLAASSYQPVNRNGKWQGYVVHSPAGAMEFLFDDLIGAAKPAVKETEFVTIGSGAAKVVITNAKGEPIRYRVSMTNDGWKVSEILSGRPVK